MVKIKDGETVVWVPLDRITPTPHNKRKIDRKSADFKSFCDNVMEVGFIEPTVGRYLGSPDEPEETRMVELLVGRRRFEAAKALMMNGLPMVIRDYDDRMAYTVTVVENLQREDLTPIQEGESVQVLVGMGWDRKSIADHLGKSEAWVARRAALSGLSKRWLKAIADEKHWSHAWPATLLEAVAGLPANSQDLALDRLQDEDGLRDYDVPGVPKLTDVESFIDQFVLQTLGSAQWALDDETMPGGACVTCTKRSDAQPLLFPVRDAKKKEAQASRCLDRECYTKKEAHFVQLQIDQTKASTGAEPIKIVSPNGIEWERYQDLKKQDDVRDAYDVTPAKKSAKGAVRAITIAGQGAGKVQWVVPTKRTTPGMPTSSGPRQKGQTMSMKEKRDALEKRRRIYVIHMIRDRLNDYLGNPTRENAPQQVRDSGREGLLVWLLAFGTFWNANDSGNDVADNAKQSYQHASGWPLHDAIATGAWDTILARLWEHVVRVMHHRVAVQFGGGEFGRRQVERVYNDAKRIATEFAGWDFDAMRVLAEQAHPVPKSWAAKEKKPKTTRSKKTKKATTKKAETKKATTAKATPKKKAAGSRKRGSAQSEENLKEVVGELHGCRPKRKRASKKTKTKTAAKK